MNHTMSPETYRGSSREPVDPNANPVDTFIKMMQQDSDDDPKQLLMMLSGIVRSVSTQMPGVPVYVQQSGIEFAHRLELWLSGQSIPDMPEAPKSVQEPEPAPSDPQPESEAPQPAA
jgi:hypothetical protein